MEMVSYFLDFVLHIDVHLFELVEQYGLWVYAILFVIVFCETGLVVTPFLPGDSLLFASGVVAGAGLMGYGEIMLVLLAAVIIFSNQRIVGVRKSYATVSGKGGRATLMPLGKAKKPLMAFLMVFLFLAMVVPFFVLIMETFQITTGAGYGLDNLTPTTKASSGIPSSSVPSGTPSA